MGDSPTSRVLRGCIKPDEPKKPAKHPHKTQADYEKLAAKLTKGDTSIKQAMMECGWSEKTANLGRAGIPKKALALMPKKAKNLIEKGRAALADPQVFEQLAMGRLAENIEQGKDGGVQSVKLAGSHKNLDWWTRVQSNGDIIIHAPENSSVLAMLRTPAESDD